MRAVGRFDGVVLTNRCHFANPDNLRTMNKEINGQTRWSPEQFGAFASGTAEGADPTKTACPVCKGTGFDFNHRWDEGWSAACETCAGYGEVEK